MKKLSIEEQKRIQEQVERISTGRRKIMENAGEYGRKMAAKIATRRERELSVIEFHSLFSSTDITEI